MSISFSRSLALGAALALAVAAACALAVPGAHAASLITCPAGNVTGTYSPALTNTPALVGISSTTNYGTCVSASGPPIRTGSRSATLPPGLRSCTDLLISRTGVPATINWSTGTTSSVVVDFVSSYITGGILQTTATGTVVAGDFTGGHVVDVSAVVGASPLACGTTGVSSASGPVTLTITP